MPRDARLYMTFPNDFHRHPKIMRLPVDVRWAFVEMNGEARIADNDGVFPVDDADFMWGRDVMDALVGSHPTRPLVLRTGDQYVIRDYGEHQQTRAQREELSAKKAEAGRKGGLAKSQARASTSQANSGKPKQSQSQSQSQSPESEIDQTDTQVSLSSNESERASEHGQTDDDISRAVLTGYGIDPERLIYHIASRAGRGVTVTEAKNVATAILARGDNVAKPQAYVLRSITNSPAEVRDQIDASRPKSTRAPECPDHPHYPIPCERCAREAAEQE